MNENVNSSHIVDVPAGTNLAVWLRLAGYSLPFDCGGNGRCRRCMIEVLSSGENSAEQPSLRRVLACQTETKESIRIRIPDSFNFELPVTFDRAIKKGKIAKPPTRLGLALDLGTTTIAIALVDLATGNIVQAGSIWNPQIQYGSDVITRIQFANRRNSNKKLLQKLVIDAINRLTEALLRRGDLAEGTIKKGAVAGNTVMEYLFLGLDPEPIGLAPFTPPVKEFSPFSVSAFGLPGAARSSWRVFPVFSGFVGGDVASGLYSLSRNARLSSNAPQLYYDLGTNGEMGLFHQGHWTVTSTAAGPAFEGYGLEYGMPAKPGAIEKVEYHNSLICKTIDSLPACGICGSGLVDLLAILLRCGLLDSRGRFVTTTKESELTSRLDRIQGLPAFRLSLPFEPSVWLTQKDVRQIQLAVGAVRTGMTLLLRDQKTTFSELETLFIAGNFGNHLRKAPSRQIGLFPPEIPLKRIEFVGNLALQGAVESLLDPGCHRHVTSLLKKTQHIELATFPEFSSVFVDSLSFPGT